MPLDRPGPFKNATRWSDLARPNGGRDSFYRDSSATFSNGGAQRVEYDRTRNAF